MQEKKLTAGIYTLGCKVNQYESEAISEALASKGICVLPASEICDIYVINTCTVTAESDRKACQFIRRAIQRNPDAYI
ncbi:MAG: tRNA (N(6)-L-threonylcarbamoyladenosine(37)-C(2))-methylthiotransferase MtaB, partial [Clostridia bacterium]|nr:tRNA (N(6)-L-threonylcarbamoyladenosine(37)-C(2))-methylthiotransferase MtaB [Clostridia bacterium]